MDLNSFLIFVISAGGNAIAASWILERITWYQAQSPDNKQYIFFGVAALLSVIAYSVLTYASPGVMTFIAPYFQMIGATFYAVFFGKQFHEVDKK
jgi:hypothetical protein